MTGLNSKSSNFLKKLTCFSSKVNKDESPVNTHLKSQSNKYLSFNYTDSIHALKQKDL